MEEIFTKRMILTGTQVNYFFICKRKLWFFSNGLSMEQESEDVILGKLLHEKSYSRMEKDIMIDRISIDFVRKGDEIIIHEVKKSKKMEDAHRYQLLYYIYCLQKKGIKARGVIDYPLLRRKEEVKLIDIREIERILEEIKEIVSMKQPPSPERKRYCRKCSYFEMCWI